MTPLKTMLEDHRELLNAARRATGIADLIPIQLDDFEYPLLKQSVRGPVLPINGGLIRDWDRFNRATWSGLYLGIRTYTIRGISFVRVVVQTPDHVPYYVYNFFAVSRREYRTLYRIAKACQSTTNRDEPAPILESKTLNAIIQNTIGFLDSDKLAEIRSFGVRPKRGLLLTGPPGNGKTSACRYVWQECQKHGLDYKIVSPDDYRSARSDSDPAKAIKNLFRVDRPGVIFFDDLDLALRSRISAEIPEDQAVFLSALDGIESQTAIVYVFTTNMGPEMIDAAFLRPGRLDVILHFPKPSSELRRQYFHRWPESLRANLDVDRAVAQTDGFSFAEIEELKSLLVLHFAESRSWDWTWAVNQFRSNRSEVQGGTRKRIVGFAPEKPMDQMDEVPSVASRFHRE